jgi:hypothetical protein
MSFTTGTGFSLEGGRCVVHTTRGDLRPQSDRAVTRGVQHQFHMRRLSGGAVEFWQSLRNVNPETLAVSSIRMFDGVLELEGAGWRMAHSELFQYEKFFDNYSYFTDGLFSAMPGVEGEFGMSENFPFPAIVFMHPERGSVLMGVLSQERCKPCWTLRPSGRRTRFTAEDRFTGVPHIRVKEGQELATERWVVLHTPGGFEEAVEAYYRLLQTRVEFVGADSILRRAVLWGSWNYNYRPRGHMDVTHDVVAANARALAKLAPGRPCFAMIDDGYQRGSSEGVAKGWFATCLEIFHPDGQTPHDPKLFPKGMKGAADAIRKAGAEPAIWATPRIHRDSSLAAARGLLATVIRLFKPARRTLNGVSNAGINNLPASHLVLEREDGVYEAHLNWMWMGRAVRLPKPVRDLWTGKRMSGTIRIPPHGVVWFKR